MRHVAPELVERATAGDPAALDELVRAVSDDIFRLAQRMLWHPHDAEDATQEILVKLLTRLSTFRGDALFSTWIPPTRAAANGASERQSDRVASTPPSCCSHAASGGRWSRCSALTTPRPSCAAIPLRAPEKVAEVIARVLGRQSTTGVPAA